MKTKSDWWLILGGVALVVIVIAGSVIREWRLIHGLRALERIEAQLEKGGAK